ncbi:ATP-dependent DNA helicase pfh1 [Exaiptasia diaphana]|uniref:ATP-dependent DNA helicase n=1 Tax=Exaiptasia diaphana TaxID=2652724 RepID=A0A913XWA5_EXADI|nr:ATP-dependent DNA helicase pfh1 [Exaiptasia diaphana]
MNACLSENHKKIERIIDEGYNIFISGRTGSGKSFLLRYLIEKFKQNGRHFAVTALTGIAGENVGGRTIHSFAGIGTGSIDTHQLIASISANIQAVERWRQCSILIIDEVSMVSRELFEKLEDIARATRECTIPFGGIQLILAGDFCQLKPVDTENRKDQDLFCFLSPLWDVCIDLSVFFEENYRQNEPELRHVVDDFRSCELSNFSRHFISQALRRPLDCDPFEIVRLHSHRDSVSESNDTYLKQLPGEAKMFVSVDTGSADSLKQCSAPKNLALKVNARVVLLKNISHRLVDGLRGNVLYFYENWPCVRFDNGEIVIIKEEMFAVEEEGRVSATRKQIPLDLAYALTIHRSQGMSFDFVEVDISSVFEPGQAYVAVSRAKTVHGLRITKLPQTMPQISPLVKEFYSSKTVSADDLDVPTVLSNKKKCECNSIPFIKIDTCLPVLSPAQEPKEVHLSEEPREIPQHCYDKIHKKVKEDAEISEDIAKVLSEVGEQNIDGINLFIKWIWQIYMQVHNMKQHSPPDLIDKKKWSGVTSDLHDICRSKQMLEKWKGCVRNFVANTERLQYHTAEQSMLNLYIRLPVLYPQAIQLLQFLFSIKTNSQEKRQIIM